MCNIEKTLQLIWQYKQVLAYNTTKVKQSLHYVINRAKTKMIWHCWRTNRWIEITFLPLWMSLKLSMRNNYLGSPSTNFIILQQQTSHTVISISEIIKYFCFRCCFYKINDNYRKTKQKLDAFLNKMPMTFLFKLGEKCEDRCDIKYWSGA